jgi:hypothetical protein
MDIEEPPKKEYDRKAYNRKHYLKCRETIKEQHKQYYNKNKEQVLKRCDEYRIKNKERIVSKQICPCGGQYLLCHKSRHFATKIHQTFKNKLNLSNVS